MRLWAALLATFPFVVVSGAARRPSIVPAPAHMELRRGGFDLGTRVAIAAQPGSDEALRIGNYLADKLQGKTRAEVHVGDSTSNVISLTCVGVDPKLGAEGYELLSSPNGVIIRAPQPAGLFYGVQTLLQMLERGRRGWDVPSATIFDQPRFPWRGLLLDVSRHFRTKEFVEHYIDLLAMHKLNVLHWHLVDDQGWRLEIKRYPKLTEVGAWRIEDGKPYGGFYTQDDVREIVKYAADRFVTVEPEIEMPGHCDASLASYPENSCTGGPFKVPSLWGVYGDVYCPGREETFTFLENVLDEVMDLFPSKFIHIGGDEVPKDRWHNCPRCQARMAAEHLSNEEELQSYFIRRIDKYLASKGRRLVGWDEILEGGLAQGATVQSWRGMDGAVAAAKSGHDVISSPTSHCYLDYNYETTPVEKSYSFEPVPPELSPEQAKHILGGEGNIWAELTPEPADTDRQVFPRLLALSEVFWSPQRERNWNDFRGRLAVDLDRLDSLGVKYYIAPPEFGSGDVVFTDRTRLVLERQDRENPVVYTLDGSDPSEESPRYDHPIELRDSVTLKAATLHNGRLSRVVTRQYKKEVLRPAASASTVPGLQWAAYPGTFKNLPDFSALTPADSGVCPEPSLGVTREGTFALLFTGYVEVPRDGVYTFYVTSDDGAKLYIDQDLVVANDGLHAPTERDGQVALKAGKHLLRLEYFQGGGAASLEVALAGPGISRSKLATSAWSH